MTDRPPHIILTRLWSDSDGTYGHLRVSNFQCFTIERPWLGNIPYESCIKSGLYLSRLGRYNRGGYPAYVLEDVVGRTDIKIHSANKPEELAGCIAPVEMLKITGGQVVGTNSKHTLKAFMEAVDSDVAHLLVVGV